METLVFETALGYTALARADEKVQALSFGHSSEGAAIKALAKSLSASSREAAPYRAFLETDFLEVDFVPAGEDELVDRILDFSRGEMTSFDDLEIDYSHLTAFGRRVTAACRKLSWGETLTYGELARRAGRPRAARAVGSVMARNRVPLIVPCHRVVPASGGLGRFSAPQGVSMKRRLLHMEQQASALLAK